jgi:STE24 endopeptidase
MNSSHLAVLVLALVLAKAGVQFWLNRLNRRHARAHAGSIPEALRETMDEATYAKSVDYTLARNAFSAFSLGWSVVLLVAVLFSGALPWFFDWYKSQVGGGHWSMAGFLVLVPLVLSVFSLPLGWYGQFRLEERFGFNTTTPATWWADWAKGLVLSLILGWPMAALVLWLIAASDWWWIWAWGSVMVFQLLMVILAPQIIMPLFNKFTPLPDGPLKDRLLALGERTGFNAHTIQVMDGSRRSRHSNAFFTGFGRWRKIVLFDTLIEQLGEAELEAVLAHEIGHYKKGHIPKSMALSAVGSLGGFWVLSLLVGQALLVEAFGFTHAASQPAPALLLLALLGGTVFFWLTPLANLLSRRYEYEADAYAAEAMGGTDSMVGALRKLAEQNLSNLVPHPVFSWVYYSHPTLLEREQALGNQPA